MHLCFQFCVILSHVCNHHDNLDTNFSIIPKDMLLCTVIPTILSLASGNEESVFHLCNHIISKIIWRHTVYNILMSFFTQHDAFEIHPTTWMDQ